MKTRYLRVPQNFSQVPFFLCPENCASKNRVEKIPSMITQKIHKSQIIMRLGLCDQKILRISRQQEADDVEILISGLQIFGTEE